MIKINFDLNFSPSYHDEHDPFPELTEEKIGETEQNRTDVATKRATKWGMKILQAIALQFYQRNVQLA